MTAGRQACPWRTRTVPALGATAGCAERRGDVLWDPVLAPIRWDSFPVFPYRNTISLLIRPPGVGTIEETGRASPGRRPGGYGRAVRVSRAHGEVRMDRSTPDPVEAVDDVEVAAPEDPLDSVAYRLWRKAVRFGTWDPAAIDLAPDREHYARLDETRRAYLERFCAAFHNAEENVARLFCPWIMSVPPVWQQAFLGTQLVEEYKHTDFFVRYFDEVFGHRRFGTALANPVHETLAERGRRLLASLVEEDGDREMLLVEAVTHYQGIIEGVQATTGYHIFLDVFARKGLLPGLSEGFRNIQMDEGRHVSFGLSLLRHYAHRDPGYGRRIREMFEEYLPLIRVRYGQTMVVDGREYGPPPEERGVEKLMRFYTRRLADIFH